MSYGVFSALSRLLRGLLCYLTIETTPIFENSLIAYGIDQIVSLYTIMWLISYTIVGQGFGYRRGDDSIIGSVLYFVVYIIITLLTWGILAILTALGVIPV